MLVQVLWSGGWGTGAGGWTQDMDTDTKFTTLRDATIVGDITGG